MRFVSFLLGVIFFSTYINASVYQKLSLADAIELVKSKNIEVELADIQTKTARVQKEITTAMHYGKLDLTSKLIRSNEALNVFGFKLSNREASFRDFGAAAFAMTNLDEQPNDLNNPEARNFFQTSLKYEVALYAGGRIKASEEMMHLYQNMSSFDKEKVLANKIYELKKTYYDLSLLEKTLSNLALIKKNIHHLENMTSNMIQEGYAKDVDLLEVQSKLADINRLMHQVELNKKLSYIFLEFLINEKVESVELRSLASLEVLLSQEEVLKQNTSLAKARLALKIQDKNLLLQKAAFLPNVGAFGEYGSSDDSFLGEFSEHDYYTVGAQLTWNLFDGLASSKNIEKSRLEKLKAKKQMALAKKGIAVQVSRLLTQIKSLDFEIESLTKELNLSKRIYENYLGRYAEKLVSIDDVLLKQSTQITQTLKLLETQNRKNERVLTLYKLANKGEK